MEDIDYLVKRYGAKAIYFREDNFTLNWKRVSRFCELLASRPYNIKWMCESRVDSLDLKKLRIMKESGLSALFLGLESGTQRMLNFYDKGITLDQTRSAAESCRKAGVFMAGSFVVGGPTETVEEIKQTVDFAQSLKLSTCWLNVFVGIPKSKMWRYAIENNLVEYKDDRGLIYLNGHNSRTNCFYEDDPSTRIPDGPGEDGFINRYYEELEKNSYHRQANLIDQKEQTKNSSIDYPAEKTRKARPLVSVLMAVHNNENIVAEAIDSILEQTFEDFEFLILDDGSTDRTYEKLRSFDDPRITVVRLPHMGLTKALNMGVQLCRGSYIARMDADDRSFSGRFDAQVALLTSNVKLGAVGTWFNEIDDQGKRIKTIQALSDPEAIKRGLLLQNWFCHSSVMFRISAAVEVSGSIEHIWDENMVYAQDYDLWLRMSEKYDLANIPRVLHEWRLSSNGLSVSKNREQQRCASHARNNAIRRLSSKHENANQPESSKKTVNSGSPTVSIIMPTYNRDHLIKESIDSVLSQTWREFELIVVDDGGTGATGDLIRSYGDSRIKYNRISHRGLSGALNHGLSLVRGAYVGYLDDDDIYYPHHIETLVSNLDKGTTAVVYSDSVRAIQKPYSENGRHVEYRVVRRAPSWKVDFSRELYLFANYTPILTVMHRAELVERTGSFDENLDVLMDWDFWIRMAQQADFRRIPISTCEFRVREDGSNMSAEKASAFQKCRRIIADKYRPLMNPVLSGAPSSSVSVRVEEPVN